ncbi:MAG: DUF933 domain-containing protein [Candidatus Omnitrophica bacterium]|nr:DUF933 domain-containing protein [Candidatus Omnitrophota bacterium]
MGGVSFKKGEHMPEGITLHLGTIKLEDERLYNLAKKVGSKKITFSEIGIIDLALYEQNKKNCFDSSFLREADGFVVVVRCFEYPGAISFNPLKDAKGIEEELILKDLEVIQKRMDRIEQDIKKGKKEEKELEVLRKLSQHLEDNKALRNVRLEAGEEKQLCGFKFLSQKPIFFVLNVDERMGLTEIEEIGKSFTQEGYNFILTSLKIENELNEMEEKERFVFLETFGFKDLIKERFLSACLSFLNLVSFFTVKGEEAKAWLIEKNTPAIKAAGKIHSDIEKGFIKAEVINYKDFVEVGFSFSEARAKGLVHLESKDYIVNDGDIIDFRFAI